MLLVPTIGRGDFVFVRTGQMGQVRDCGSWGDYAGGAAPGLGVNAVPWVGDRQITAVATDTWGMEVRPNETPDTNQPLHIIFIVHNGMSLIGSPSERVMPVKCLVLPVGRHLQHLDQTPTQASAARFDAVDVPLTAMRAGVRPTRRPIRPSCRSDATSRVPSLA